MCLFCSNHESGHSSKVDYLCGKCVQMFLGLDKDKVSGLRAKIIQKNNPRMLRGLNLFYGRA